jgi:hypothetical protein
MNARAKVFRDDNGNRMVFPGWVYYDRAAEPLETTWWSRAMMMRTATGLEIEDGWLEFDPEKFPHIDTTIGSRGFAHGSERVFVFAGPAFDEILAAA